MATNNIESLYTRDENGGPVDISQNYLGRTKKEMPTIGSWFKRIQRKAEENTNKPIIVNIIPSIISKYINIEKYLCF